MTHLEELTKKIQNVCPELMDLEFGCFVEIEDSFEGHPAPFNPEGKNVTILQKLRVIKYKQFKHLTKIQTLHYLLLEDGVTRKLEGDEKFKKHVKVLGSSIQLAHVLRAIEGWYWGDEMANMSGYEWYVNELLKLWDLSQDLSHQSPEVIEFLYNIICK